MKSGGQKKKSAEYRADELMLMPMLMLNFLGFFYTHKIGKHCFFVAKVQSFHALDRAKGARFSRVKRAHAKFKASYGAKDIGIAALYISFPCHPCVYVGMGFNNLNC